MESQYHSYVEKISPSSRLKSLYNSHKEITLVLLTFIILIIFSLLIYFLDASNLSYTAFKITHLKEMKHLTGKRPAFDAASGYVATGYLYRATQNTFEVATGYDKIVLFYDKNTVFQKTENTGVKDGNEITSVTPYSAKDFFTRFTGSRVQVYYDTKENKNTATGIEVL